MTLSRITGTLFILIIGIALLAGCSSLTGDKNPDVNISQSPGQSDASYRVALHQPVAQSAYVKMDTDIYNIGEVVEFTVTNNGFRTLDCSGNPPLFSVKFQDGHGTWATRMGTDRPNESEKSTLLPGTSTTVYRFVTTGWDPGRYRILHDCGVEREILIRAVPIVTPAAAVCPSVNTSNTSLWIVINAIGDQYASRPFTIAGTTNLPAGQELKCTIFSIASGNTTPAAREESSFTTTVQEGSCGTNTWSATGEIQTSGEFFIGVTDSGRKTSAMKRFTVIPP